MDTDEDYCQQLLEEYEILSRRLEELDFTSPDFDDSELPPGIESGDYERLLEIREVLETECDIEVPDEEERDLDIPDYAGKSPSEPMDFDSE